MSLLRYTKHTAAAVLLLTSAQANAFAPTNFFRSYDAAIQLPFADRDTDFMLGLQVEAGERDKCRNLNRDPRNVLQIYDDTQATLAMIEDPVPGATADPAFVAARFGVLTALGVSFDPPLPADGTTGQLLLTGNFKEADFTFLSAYHFLHSRTFGTFSFSAFVPVVYKKVSNVSILDLTDPNAIIGGGIVLPRGTRVQQFLTNDLKNNVKRMGNLNLDDWQKTDIGDVSFFIDWRKDVHTEHSLFNTVTFLAKLGVTCPTAEKRDEDQAFSMALGNDGAWGIPLGVGFHVDLMHHVTVGGNYDVTFLFDETHNRRLKTHPNQTEFLLINKGRATKKHGETWQADGFIRIHRVIKGLSAKFAYQFVRHNEDELTPKTAGFDKTIINSARSLRAWHVHNYIFSVDYNLAPHGDDDEDAHRRIVPQISLFFKFADDAKNLIDTRTIGGQLGFSF